MLFERFKSLIDFINRDGYEAFINMLLHRKDVRAYYKAKYGTTMSRGNFTWDWTDKLALDSTVLFALMITGILPALYLINRVVGVVLNPFAWAKNSVKSFQTTILLLGATSALGIVASLISFGFTSPNSNPVTVVSLLAGVMPYGAALGLIVWGAVMIGAAVAYAAKCNAKLTVGNTYRAYSWKHDVSKLNESLFCDMSIRQPLNTLQENLLCENAKLKKLVRTGDASVEGRVEEAEELIAEGKVIINSLEGLMKVQKAGGNLSPKEAEVAELFGKKGGGIKRNGVQYTSLISYWQEMAKSFDKDYIAVPPEGFALDVEASRAKIVFRSGVQ